MKRFLFGLLLAGACVGVSAQDASKPPAPTAQDAPRPQTPSPLLLEIGATTRTDAVKALGSPRSTNETGRFSILLWSDAKVGEMNFIVLTFGANGLLRAKKIMGNTASMFGNPVPDVSGSAPDPHVDMTPKDPREVNLAKLFTKSKVVLRTNDLDFALDSVHGGLAFTSAFLTVLVYSDFPDLIAPVRTKDAQLAILLSHAGSIRGDFFLVKAKSNEGQNTRSVKMGNSGFGTVSNTTMPDSDWVIPTTHTEIRPGIWEIKPNKALKRGEYGIYVVGPAKLFDFGVDS